LASPKVRTKITLGDRSYSCAAPRLWNLLPSMMQSISTSPKVRTKITLGDRSYSCAAPRLWNLLPSMMQSISSAVEYFHRNCMVQIS
ncbi:unnamed protein product, partial [Porites evermanni]